MHSKTKIALAIVDDHPMILEGLKSLWQDVPEVSVSCFTQGHDFLAYNLLNPVDIVLLDIVLHDGTGLDFCKSIKQQSPKTLVIAVSNQAERSIIFQFIQNGGNGYILKNADAQEIVSCVNKALMGELALSKEVQALMLSSAQVSRDIPRLTKREKQILLAIANGHTSAEIAAMLFISVITVETHRRNLLQKFKVKNMIELVKTAMELKLL